MPHCVDRDLAILPTRWQQKDWFQPIPRRFVRRCLFQPLLPIRQAGHFAGRQAWDSPPLRCGGHPSVLSNARWRRRVRRSIQKQSVDHAWQRNERCHARLPVFLPDRPCPASRQAPHLDRILAQLSNDLNQVLLLRSEGASFSSATASEGLE